MGEGAETGWYLGIDLGTTGMSAVLLNRERCELHPIYWMAPASVATSEVAIDPASERWFRLPIQAAIDPAVGADPPALGGLPQQANLLEMQAPAQLIQGVRPYLNNCIPYYSLASLQWEPMLQWTDETILPLLILRQVLQQGVATLSQAAPGGSEQTPLVVGAVGLEAEQVQDALHELMAVVVGYPAHWSDAYLENVRSVILAAGLVAQPSQIVVVEEAIAVLLSELPSAEGQSPVLPQRLSKKSSLPGLSWDGTTLMLSAGASVTELALVNLPAQLPDLAEDAFHYRSINYAGDALDQDIICQLLYPLGMQNATSVVLAGDRSNPADVLPLDNLISENGANQWHWQVTLEEPDPWQSLTLDRLTLPSPGEPDLAKRHQLQQRLGGSAFGQGLLQAAKQLKLALQHSDQFIVQVGEQRWAIAREDLGSRVVLPYIQRLNRELNALLHRQQASILNINQVICTGGTASLGAIARWLRQKLPNATIIQDTYAAAIDSPPTCSRIAYGLAALPLHPQLMNSPRHYSDYHLLLELLHIFPAHPLLLAEIVQELQRRGMDVEAHHPRLVALLEGHLPAGLVPVAADAYLAPVSVANPDYQKVLAAPAFHKTSPHTYQLNPNQWQYLRQYLEALKLTTWRSPSATHRSTPTSSM